MRARLFPGLFTRLSSFVWRHSVPLPRSLFPSVFTLPLSRFSTDSTSGKSFNYSNGSPGGYISRSCLEGFLTGPLTFAFPSSVLEADLGQKVPPAELSESLQSGKGTRVGIRGSSWVWLSSSGSGVRFCKRPERNWQPGPLGAGNWRVGCPG